MYLFVKYYSDHIQVPSCKTILTCILSILLDDFENGFENLCYSQYY